MGLRTACSEAVDTLPLTKRNTAQPPKHARNRAGRPAGAPLPPMDYDCQRASLAAHRRSVNTPHTPPSRRAPFQPDRFFGSYHGTFSALDSATLVFLQLVLPIIDNSYYYN